MEKDSVDIVDTVDIYSNTQDNVKEDIEICSGVIKSTSTKSTRQLELDVICLNILRDFLAFLWREKRQNPDYLCKTKEIKISNKEIYESFNCCLHDKKLGGVSPRTLKYYLSYFGFEQGINRKHLKIKLINEENGQSRLCNIFTPFVLEKLGITPQEELVIKNG